jgi:hypothetical protein
MLSGESYFHLPQGLGKSFQPGILNGYFNDMTGKIKWNGLVDKEGIPVAQLTDGSLCYFPTMIIQKALGHYDHYLFTGDSKDKVEFLRICNWLVKNQDAHGGWEVEGFMASGALSQYSAMSQGEAISAFVRAWKETNDQKYLDAAIKAHRLMITPMGEGGTAYYDGDDIYFEEYPVSGKNSILNGWIFALFGSYDLSLATKGDSGNYFDKSLNTLLRALHFFDSGFWSLYDEKGALASPFYHDLHISQLEALFIVSREQVFKQHIVSWKRYRKSFFKRNYSIILKAYQKLKNPAQTVVLK